MGSLPVSILIFTRKMKIIKLLQCIIAFGQSLADSEGQRELPGDDFLAPNSVPMMGRKRGGRIFEENFLAPRKRGKFYGLQSILPASPIMRLKKEEKESPFVYRTPWHIGKRKVDDLEKRSAALSDIYTAAWIGSLFKPSSESKLKSRKM